MKRPVWRSAFSCWLAFGLVASLSLSCGGRSRGKSSKSKSGQSRVAVIDLRGGAPEVADSGGFFPLPPGHTFVGLIRSIDRVKSDAGVKSVMVYVGGPSLGFARSLELGQALNSLRAKKKVICHAHELDNSRALLTLAGCDETWLSAAGDVSTVGIAAEITYFKGALDRVGIVSDMLAMGRFKSGPEALTREGPSEASAENLTLTLRDLRGEWLTGAATDKAPLRAALEDGPHTPDRAKALGIVTHIGYEEEALSSAKGHAHVEATEVFFGPSLARQDGPSLGQIVRLLARGSDEKEDEPHVAVVPMAGSITVSAGGPLSDSGITSEAFVRTLKRLREDESAKAVVVRIDSPGGSPLASDLIWKQLMLLREKKPVVVSIGSMAASGGYYIACAGTKIVANPSAIVGSIGVFGGKIVLGGALEKLGVKSYSFPASPEPGAASRALYLSPMSSWDEPTRQKMRESMQRIYDLFVARVAEGRGIPVEDVYKTAEGEIFLSKVGKERKLVDEIGGIQRAIELGLELAKLPKDTPVTIEGAKESVLETLLLGDDADDAAIEAALKAYVEKKKMSMSLDPRLMLLEQLRTHSSALAPLLSGESVVAALPYQIELH